MMTLWRAQQIYLPRYPRICDECKVELIETGESFHKNRSKSPGDRVTTEQGTDIGGWNWEKFARSAQSCRTC